MIIGDDKEKVIENIKEATEQGKYNKKVEINDPKLTKDEREKTIRKYLKNKDKVSFKIKTEIAESVISVLTKILNKDTEIVGIENVKGINGSAIVTSNHFNPLDNLIIQKFAKEVCKKRLYIISQETNFAMSGIVGFFMKYSRTIPISRQLDYMKREFPKTIKDILDGNNFILIYPEQEMWFNYKKPRPLKEGAYYFAAQNNVPILSCFVEMKETDEKAYNKKLDYKLEIEDIAGWRNK